MSTSLSNLRLKGIRHQHASPVIDLENAGVSYQSSNNRNADRALTDLTFRINPGEQVAVVGPNGAGKSTLIKLVAGIIQPTSGSVEVYGTGPDGHICIGYVPQRSQIDFSFPVTVEEVVMMGRVGKIGLFRWPKSRDWSVVHESLSRVFASDLSKRQIGELSGGQQQRVFIARALAQEAEILLLDEPLAGLDIPSQEAIFEILEGLSPDNVTVMLATHDLELAADRFDRVMLLNKRLIAFDRPSVVLTPEYLMSAYSGHLHRINGEEGPILLTDECHDPVGQI
ncbi:MAG TPA: metal ABC transporter ATP-binding protein [candidate division Zixibacteria bacterium]|nr:metal ABC transporter ATP-binding protein [candidate division Zixibacteria bacterium]